MMTLFSVSRKLEPSVHKHMTTVRINQTVDYKCGDGQGEVWTVFKMSDTPLEHYSGVFKKRVAVNSRMYCSPSLFLLATRTLSETKHSELFNHAVVASANALNNTAFAAATWPTAFTPTLKFGNLVQAASACQSSE